MVWLPFLFFDRTFARYLLSLQIARYFGYKFEYFNQDLAPTDTISEGELRNLIMYDFEQPELVAYDLNTSIAKNLDRLVTSNEIKTIMKTFLQGTVVNTELPANLKNFVVEARKIYPDMTTRDIMNEVLTVITSDKERGYNKYKDTTWPMNNEDLTKDICGFATNNSRHNQVLCFSKIAENNQFCAFSCPWQKTV